jgi:DnaJ-class molecular chaperone
MSKKEKCPDCKGSGYYGRFGACSKCNGLGLIDK